MSLLVASIACGDEGEMAERAGQALATGADVAELRLDALERPEKIEWKWFGELPRGRWLATMRSSGQGGRCALPAPQVLEQLMGAAARGAGYVDVEWGLIESGVLGGAEEANFPAGEEVETIVSWHDFDGHAGELGERVARMASSVAGAIVKVAWRCTDIAENFAAFEVMRAGPGRRLAICMGEKGVLSRVLARKFGAFGTFCAPSAGRSTAPGQITVRELRDLYGWSRQTERTEVFGVIGSPVGHSLSPAVFNAQFAADGFDGVYVPLLIDDEDELVGFLEGCRERPWLDVGGFSVTLPHKEAVLKWSAAQAEPAALRIGAANTLDFRGATVRAYNTDYAGALAALESVLGAGSADWGRMRAAVLGAGGVARAVVAGLKDRGCCVTVYNRSAARADELAAAFGCSARPWAERLKPAGEVVVNCTSVGMAPQVEETPLPAEALRPEMTVFDTVYNPRQTRLLREARLAGCRTIDGVALFVHQAAAQYRIWTGAEADTALMTEIVTKRLSRPVDDGRDAGASE